jgi:RNA polymerase sigma-70 factor (ECF subfamily)
MDDDSTPNKPPPRADRFATTHWSVVVRAGQSGTPGACRALSALCENYWFPLYAFVRQAGHSAEEAQDLTQAFFVELLAKNVLAVADPQRGKFRSFLLGAMKHFVSKEHRRQRAQKRGGRQTVLSLDFIAGENRYRGMEPADNLTPERLYEKRWALALLDLAFVRLRDEFSAAGILPQFDVLKQFLGGRAADVSYRQIGEELAMTEGAVKVAVHRMRRRYRELLRDEIAQTVSGPEELEDELRDLLAAVGPEK